MVFHRESRQLRSDSDTAHGFPGRATVGRGSVPHAPPTATPATKMTSMQIRDLMTKIPQRIAV